MPYVGDGTYARPARRPDDRPPDAPLEVFNFKALPDRLVPLAMLPLLEYIWTQLADPARPTLVVLDEGWALLNHPASAPFVAEVTRTGRHHGLVTLNLSQLITDYPAPPARRWWRTRRSALLLAQHPTPSRSAAGLRAHRGRARGGRAAPDRQGPGGGRVPARAGGGGRRRDPAHGHARGVLALHQPQPERELREAAIPGTAATSGRRCGRWPA